MTRDDANGVGLATWCRGCGTKHASAARCTELVDVVEPETQRWRVGVLTPTGVQGYGVLVARATNGWRARIVTFPSILWMVPGGGQTMKFLASSEEQVVREAVGFVREHCVARGYVMRDELELAATGVGALGARGGPRTGVAAPRFARRFPARFGRSRPSIPAVTANVSETGLFVSTDQPMAVGAPLGIMLEFEHGKVPLRGSVIWKRSETDGVQGSGMGVRLINAPPMYVSYIRALG